MKAEVIAERGLNVRAGPGVFSRRKGALPFGAAVEVVEKRGVWGRIVRPLEGWIHLGYTRPVEGERQDWLASEALDLSHWNSIHPLFWRSARPWMVIHKATQGTYLLDKRFGERWALLRWLGWPRGAYHFYDPDQPGLAQAKVFCRVVSPEAGELLALDFERHPKRRSLRQVRQDVRDFLNYLADRMGYPPLVYTGAYIWNAVIGPQEWARQFPLWIAQYTRAGQPLLPDGWNTWALWQYTSSGRWPGVAGRVDRNRVHKEFARWYGEKFHAVA